MPVNSRFSTSHQRLAEWKQLADAGYRVVVPSFTVSQAAELLGVSPDTVRRWVDAGQLGAARTSGGRRRIDGEELARFSSTRAQPSTPPVSESARNHFSGLITKVTKDKVMAQVELQAGPFRVVSLMSREAADELNLAPGMMAVASVKSTNVVIEVPPN